MAINFITPDLLLSRQAAGIKAMGYVHVDVGQMCEDMQEVFNTPRQMAAVEKHLAKYIPTELPVCVSSVEDSRRLCLKHHIPDTSNMAGAVAFNLDTRYPAVLLLMEEYVGDLTVIKHELVHYRQFTDGYLEYSETGDINWLKPGEEQSINGTEDMIKRNRIATSKWDLLAHELTKPWELEAYATTTPRHVRQTFPEHCQKVMERYLLTH